MLARVSSQNKITSSSLEATVSSREAPDSSRLPRRSFCQRFRLAPSDNVQSLTVARFPSIDCDCRHQLFIEHPALTKRVDLPATARLEINQRFESPENGQLTFEFVVLMRAGRDGGTGRSSISAILQNLKTQNWMSLLDHKVVSAGEASSRRTASKSRESVTVALNMAGVYELRLATAIDSESPGSSVHLLIDSASVRNAAGVPTAQLASVCCVGCVRRETRAADTVVAFSF